MSKNERYLVYPLLLIVLIYGFIGNPIIQARQGTEVFERIEAKEIIIKNNDGIEVLAIKSDIFNDGRLDIFNSDGVMVITTMRTTIDSGGGIWTLSKDGVIGAFIGTTDRGGVVRIFDKYGENPAFYGYEK